MEGIITLSSMQRRLKHLATTTLTDFNQRGRWIDLGNETITEKIEGLTNIAERADYSAIGMGFGCVD